MTAHLLLPALLLAATLASAQEVRVSPTAAPADLRALPIEWLNIEATTSGTLVAAVARPQGKGPFPALLIVHGSHGFAPEYVGLAREIAAQGFIVVSACWFQGAAPGEGDVSAPIDCPQAQPMPMGPSAQARAAVADLVTAVRQLPDVQPERVAIFGHSRGGGATINYLEHGGDVHAAILNSSGYSDEYIENAAKIRASVLILHGEKDSNGAMTTIARALQFAAALHAAAVPMETHFYPDGEHRSIFINRKQHSDEVRRIVSFLRGPAFQTRH
jgi:dienelactone hydrolase